MPSLPNLFGRYNDEFELEVGSVIDDEDFLPKTARNFLRFLIRGNPITPDLNCKAGLALIEKGLTEEKNSALLTELRIEMQCVLNNAMTVLSGTPELTPKEQRQFEIFLSNFLAAYPFMDPDVSEPLLVPQKIGGVWLAVQYRFEKIDISPRTGLLAKLIEEEDRIYAYGLVPQDAKQGASPHLLLMGTTYPTGQGADLADLYNFLPRHSVGEGHDTTELDEWINRHEQIKVTGHSKGAVMAMITAARHPGKIKQADCLNPTGLCQATLDRLNPSWSIKEKTPIINVYAQKGDPVFPLENGFLAGTNIYRISPDDDRCSNYRRFIPRWFQKAFEAHLHHFAGRANVSIEEVNTQAENNTSSRRFFADMKGTINWIVFPISYLSLCAKLVMRKIERSVSKNETEWRIALLLGCISCSIFLFPTYIPLLAALSSKGLSLKQSVAVIASANIVLALGAPIITKGTARLVSLVVNAVKNIVLGTLLVIGLPLTGLYSGVKIKLFGCCFSGDTFLPVGNFGGAFGWQSYSRVNQDLGGKVVSGDNHSAEVQPPVEKVPLLPSPLRGHSESVEDVDSLVPVYGQT